MKGTCSTLINLGLFFTLTHMATGQNIVTTIAGDGLAFPQNVTAANAPLGNLTSVVLDGHGNLYVADVSSNMVVEISPHGAIRIFAGMVCCDGTKDRHALPTNPEKRCIIRPIIAQLQHVNKYITTKRCAGYLASN